MGQVAEHSKQRGKQLFLEIESLEIAFYLSGKKKKMHIPSSCRKGDFTYFN